MPNKARQKATTEQFQGTVDVSFADAIIASSDKAVLLREEGHDPVLYIPCEVIYFAFLQPSDTVTTCPVKGRARYLNVSVKGQAENDVMWAYDSPPPLLREFLQHAAFDPDKVIMEDAPPNDPKVEEQPLISVARPSLPLTIDLAYARRMQQVAT